MGASFWHHAAPYEPGPGAALLSCQIDFHRRSGIDLARYLDARIKDMEQAVRWCQEDDPYDLLGFYQDGLSQYRQMAARGIPERPEEQIELLRQIEAISGDGIGNILDLTGVSETVEEGKVRQLSADEMQTVFRTLRSSLEEARVGLTKLAESISRGTAICFPVYKMGKPVSWLIAGYTAD